MLKGSCLCGGIQYEYAGEINELAVCHCNMCKRAQGSAFATNAPIETARFRVLTGEELMKAYHSSPEKVRVFCSECGSPIYSQRVAMPEVIRLRVGTVTHGVVPEVDYHIYCESEADWVKIASDKPRFEQNK